MKLPASKKTISTISLFLVSLFLSVYVSRPVSAYTLEHTINTTVDVTSATEVNVKQEHKLELDTANYFFPASKNYFYAYIFPAFAAQGSQLNESISKLRVKNSLSNVELTHKESLVDGSMQIKVPYYEDLGQGNDLNFGISYSTNLYSSKEGGLIEISYPGLSKDFKRKVVNKVGGYEEITTYTIRFVLPTSLGTISSVYPAAKSTITERGKTTIEFESTALIGNSVRITIGDSRLVKFVLSGKTYATNESSPDFVKDLLYNYIEIALPTGSDGTESSGQKVYYTKIEPFPTQIYTDSDGNILAKIPVSASKDGTITIEGYAILKGKAISESDKKVLLTEIPTTMSSYLAAETKYWQVNSDEIKEIVHNRIPLDVTVYGQIRKTLTFVSQNLTYKSSVSEATLSRLGALGALSSKTGVCMEYSDLMLTLLRAQGIPTRTVFGDGVGAHVDKTLKGIGHQWVGVWFPGTGWIPVDPTWSDNNREYIGHDFDHFVWYVASKSDNEPSGFNCLSWDSQSPCKDAIEVNTNPMNDIPDGTVLMTVQDLQEKINANDANSNTVTSSLQKGIASIGSSQLGRIILSKNGMLVFFGLLLYSVLVIAVASITKRLRKRKAIPPATEV